MAAARTLVGVLSSHSAKRGKFGFGRTLSLVALIMVVRPDVVDVSGDGGGVAVMGNSIVGGTTICMVGVAVADRSNI